MGLSVLSGEGCRGPTCSGRSPKVGKGRKRSQCMRIKYPELGQGSPCFLHSQPYARGFMGLGVSDSHLTLAFWTWMQNCSILVLGDTVAVYQ